MFSNCPPKEGVLAFIEKGNLECLPTMKGVPDVKITHQWMFTFWMMFNLFCYKWNRRKLFMHEQRLQWNAITLKRLQKGTKLWKNHIWTKFNSKNLLKILGISRWSVKYILQDFFSWIEKDEVLANTIF